MASEAGCLTGCYTASHHTDSPVRRRLCGISHVASSRLLRGLDGDTVRSPHLFTSVKELIVQREINAVNPDTDATFFGKGIDSNVATAAPARVALHSSCLA